MIPKTPNNVLLTGINDILVGLIFHIYIIQHTTLSVKQAFGLYPHTQRKGLCAELGKVRAHIRLHKETGLLGANHLSLEVRPLDSLERAKNALFDRQLPQAVSAAEEAVNTEHPSAEAFRFLAHLHWQFSEDADKGLETLRQGVTVHPHAWALYYDQGKIHLHRQHYREAEENFVHAKAVEGHDRAQVEEARGQCALAAGRIAAACGHFQDALQENPLALTANRELRLLHLQRARYEDFFRLWKLDHGLMHQHEAVGTITEDAERLRIWIADLQRHKSVQGRVELARALRETGLHREALVLWKAVLNSDPQHAEAKAEADILEDFTAALQRYRTLSETIYREVLTTGRRNRRQHGRALLQVLLQLGVHYPELRRIPLRPSKKNWRSVSRFYEKNFRLHIQPFFHQRGFYGTYAAFIANERYHLINPGYNPGRYVYRELARDVERSYLTWVWQYFGNSPAGWTGTEERYVYRCSDRYKAHAVEGWHLLHDPDGKQTWKEELRRQIEESHGRPLDVFFSEALLHILKHRFLEAVWEECSRSPFPGNPKVQFMQHCYQRELEASFARHEGRFALGRESIARFIGTAMFGLRRGLPSIVAAGEYRARLGELLHARIPFDPVLSMVSRGLGTNAPWAQGQTRLLQHLAEHIADHPREYPAVDRSKNIVLQLYRLDDEQIRAAARALL